MTALDEDEAKLYDRQIRLWGLSAQERIKNHSVLIYGFNLITSEIVKNIVLAGIKSLHLVIEDESKKHHNNFLVTDKSLTDIFSDVKLSISELNPRVNVKIHSNVKLEDLVEEIKTCETFIMSSCVREWKQRQDYVLNLNPKANTILFNSMGQQAFANFYFGEFEYYDEDANSPTTASSSTKKNVQTFPKVDELLEINLSSLIKGPKSQIPASLLILKMILHESFHKDGNSVTFKDWQAFSSEQNLPEALLTQDHIDSCMEEEDVPTSAIVGGFIAQMLLKAISKNSLITGNTFLFNGLDCAGKFDWYPDPVVKQAKEQDIFIDEIL